MNLIEMWNQMGFFAKAIAWILFIMSMISFGVAVERFYTFLQARKQSKLYAPQVAEAGVGVAAAVAAPRRMPSFPAASAGRRPPSAE